MKGNKKNEKTLVLMARDGLVYVAMWQFCAFAILLLLVWANEILDVFSLLFDGQPRRPDYMRACLSTAGVLLAAVITVGHTYIQQKRIISGLLTICSYCHRIRVDSEVWQRVEQYISRHGVVQFSHGICPDCFKTAINSLEEGAGGASSDGVASSPR
jgi:hypothetical protein